MLLLTEVKKNVLKINRDNTLDAMLHYGLTHDGLCCYKKIINEGVCVIIFL